MKTAFVDDAGRKVPRKYAELPELGRLTGRGNSADLKREVAEFYRHFYPREPSPEQVDRLLAEPGVSPR